MALFSERYGYVKPRDVLIREQVNEDVINVICSAFDILKEWLSRLDIHMGGWGDAEVYFELEKSVWVYFLNKRYDDFSYNKKVITGYLNDSSSWFGKLDILEYSIQWMNSSFENIECRIILDDFIDYLNKRFKDVGFAYRVVNYQICEITSEEEIKEIEQALSIGDSVKNHLDTALALLSKRPVPDCRNSIKESISAVEFLCRDVTGENTLGPALNKLEQKGILLPDFLKQAFIKLYVYTNDKSTGIRHALMDDGSTPELEEAKFMLVACSAFVNYIKAKI